MSQERVIFCNTKRGKAGEKEMTEGGGGGGGRAAANKG